MSWTAHPDPTSRNQALDLVAAILDPMLAPLGFAPGQAAATEDEGQVIFCLGKPDSADGACVDLVADLERVSDWHVVDVRYWGFPTEGWHLELDREVALPEQLSHLAQTLPRQLARR